MQDESLWLIYKGRLTLKGFAPILSILLIPVKIVLILTFSSDGVE
jgi:hypothetical protein